VRSADAGGEKNDLLQLSRDLLHRQCDARIWHIDDRVDTLAIPLTGDVCTEIGAVAMIRKDKLDLPAEHGPAEVINSHTRGLDRTWAAVRGINRSHIGEYANLDGECFLPRCAASCQGQAIAMAAPIMAQNFI
jgi:hypothetical protein